MKAILPLLLLLLSPTAFACPKNTLSCDFIKVSQSGVARTIKALSTQFESEPGQDSCKANLFVSSNLTHLDVDMNVGVSEDFEATVSMGGRFYPLETQFDVSAVKNHPFTLYYGMYRLKCVIE